MIRITAAYFSPTGNTRNAALSLMKELQAVLKKSGRETETAEDDFTSPEFRKQERRFSRDEVVVFAVPTYAGRVPNRIAPDIRRLFFGDGTRVIPLVTFGNRSYDNSLAELLDILEKNGFSPVGAAAVCTAHAFSDRMGAGRPDKKDGQLLSELAAAVCSIGLRSAVYQPPSAGGERLSVPGAADAPYYTPLGTDGQPAKFLKAVPKVKTDLCRHCGTCAEVCPMGSVSREDPEEMTGICIKCQACIRKCPARARYFDDPAFLSHVLMLEQTYDRRAESAVFYETQAEPQAGS